MSADSVSKTASSPETYRHATWLLIAIILLTWTVEFSVRMAGPHDFMDRDQQKPTGYVLDIIKNGHWASQRDVDNIVMSKPPVHPWTIVVTTWVTGELNRFSLNLPSALSVIAACLAIFFWARQYFGQHAAFWSAFSYLLTNAVYKQLGLCRTDPIFTLLILLGMIVAFEAWNKRTTWIWFYVIAAISTLTKGPLGILLALLGLVAIVWEWWTRRRSGESNEDAHLGSAKATWLSSHIAGIAFFLVVAGGWLLAAWLQDGQDFIDKVIGKELVGHAVGRREIEPLRVIGPFFYWFSRYLPWSIFALVGFWRVFMRPSEDVPTRRFERFLFCQFFFGAIVFCMATHKREDLVFPIMPAAGILAGRELQLLLPLEKYRPRRLAAACAAAIAFVGTAHYIFEWTVRVTKEQNVWTAGAIEFADEIDERVGRGFPLSYAFLTPHGPQFWLDTYIINMDPGQTRTLLTGDDPAFVVTWGDYKLRDAEAGQELYEVARASQPDDRYFRIVSNHPRLEWTDRIAMTTYDTHVLLEHAAISDIREDTYVLRARQEGAKVTIANIGDRVREIAVADPLGNILEEISLQPGDSATVDLPFEHEED